MPDLLTHVLVAFILATGLSLRYDRIDVPLVTVAMVGAMTPDLNRIELLFPGRLVSALLDIPFSWGAFHTLGGTALVVAIAAVAVHPSIRYEVVALLLLGALSHHALDCLLIKPSGRSYPVLWPLTAWRPPTPGLYHSYDRWLAPLAGSVSVAIWYIRRTR